MIHIRIAKPEDAEACGTICFNAFSTVSNHHRFPPDFPSTEHSTGLLTHAISRDDIYTIVAEVDGEIVGSNVLWENGEVAGIGPITVNPTTQGSSVGKSLMKNVLDRAEKQGYKSVRLVQAAFNNLSLALYCKLGFDVKEPISVMNGPSLNLSIPGCTVRLAEERDQATCNNLCYQIHGHTRKGDLADGIKAKSATVVIRGERITGYATVTGFFGHAVGESNEDIKALIGAAQAFAGPGILVPTRNGDLMRWCLDHGLKIVQPLSLMGLGEYNTPQGYFMPSIIF